MDREQEYRECKRGRHACERELQESDKKLQESERELQESERELQESEIWCERELQYSEQQLQDSAIWCERELQKSERQLQESEQQLQESEQQLQECEQVGEIHRTRPLAGDRNHKNRRTTKNDQEQEKPKAEHGEDDKSFKICSVMGGLDVTHYISRDVQSFFAGAIDDVELIREVISETATNGGVGHRMTLAELDTSLDRQGRGYNGTSIQTMLEAGLGYGDDRPERRADFWVSLFNLGAEATRQNYYNSTSKVDASAELAIIQAAALIFPWIIDRKSKPAFWSTNHQNGRATGSRKEPFRFDVLYSAAWIGSWGEAWAYYPPLDKVAGAPLTLGETAGDPNGTSHDAPFIEPNLPWNNPSREAFFTKPYPDFAEVGVSIISCLAPVYFTGSITNKTFDDTYIASTGLDIHVDSLSRLLDVAAKLTAGSFALLVDLDLDIVVISQEVVDKIYPERTGFEDERVTYDMSGQVMNEDRRNVTYLVSDTIFQGLTKLDNADWDGLRISLEGLQKGERDYSKLDITLRGEDDAVEFYVMKEKWKYVADWALLMFAPVNEVDDAIRVHFVEDADMVNPSRDMNNLVLNVRKGASIYGHATIRNGGTLDVSLTPSGTPGWLKLQQSIDDMQVLRAGDSLDLTFEVLTDKLAVGTTSSIISFDIQDDSYPDCFHAEEKALRVTVSVSAAYSSFLIFALFIFATFLGVYLYIERKKKEADSVWEVKKSELLYDDPPVVMGRGTFGLVVCAEYRGTKVAVKRVIPPQASNPAESSTSSTIFDYHDDFDEEEVNPQLSYKATNVEIPPEAIASAEIVDDNGVFDKEKAKPRNMYRTRRLTSEGMIPGALKSVGFIGQGETRESLPLNGKTKNKVRGHISWSGSFRYGQTSSRSTAYLKGDFVQEMRVLSKLRHPCITTFMGAVTARGEEPLLVMECMNRGSLYDILHNPSMIFEGETVLSILRDISKGMRFLHSSIPQRIHGDLKAANVLVDSNFCAKVTDFGFSIKKKLRVSGTPYWMAPELLRGANGNSAASDAYSFGILLYEVYSRRDPYFGEDYESVIRDVCDRSINRRPPAPKSMPAEVTSLLYSSCLDADPAARLEFTELDSFLKRFQAKNVDPGEDVMDRRNSRSDRNLLEEIFPPPVAAALREGRKVEPEHFDCVTIFFSDIVGYTPLSASMSPNKVSNMVDRLYEKMDSLSHTFGVYKLETIGDAWVGVTNLYNACPDDHAKRMALFAMEASQAASQCLIDEENPSRGVVQIRIGFHSGSCTAAVVGSRLPKYALFGDTINTAARMESNSGSGRVHCSDRSEELLRIQAPEISLKCRGEIIVKGKGKMTTYWVGE